jgi:hypothetical protein
MYVHCMKEVYSRREFFKVTSITLGALALNPLRVEKFYPSDILRANEVYFDFRTGRPLKEEQAVASTPEGLHDIFSDEQFVAFFRSNLMAGQFDVNEYPDGQIKDPYRKDTYTSIVSGNNTEYDPKRKVYNAVNYCGPATLTTIARTLAYTTQMRIIPDLNIQNVTQLLVKEKLMPQSGMMYADDLYNAQQIIFENWYIKAKPTVYPSDYPTNEAKGPFIIPNKRTPKEGEYYQSKSNIIKLANDMKNIYGQGGLGTMMLCIQPEAKKFCHFIVVVDSDVREYQIPRFRVQDPYNYYFYINPQKVMSADIRTSRNTLMRGRFEKMQDFGELGNYSLKSFFSKETEEQKYGIYAVWSAIPDIKKDIHWKPQESSKKETR